MQPEPATIRVVIAEDGVLLRAGLAGLLERFGFQTVAAVGDAEALKNAVAEHPVDLVITDIPYGRTISYAQLATRVGKPTATRAVGAANGRNPLSIVLPCHRVIGADGSLTGYGGGLPIKTFLLTLEGALPAAPALL